MMRSLVLVGMMGAGKTSVGRPLAAELSWPFWDSDVVIHRRFGMSAAQLEQLHGLRRLHEIELQLVGEVMSSRNSVVSVPASSVLTARGRNSLGTGYVVWLRASIATLAARVVRDSDRPILRGDASETLRRLSVERHRRFGEVADYVVDVDAREVNDIWPEILVAYWAENG